MKSRGVNTLLLITHDRLVRADLRPGRAAAVADLHEERRPAADDLPSLVEAALRLSRTRPGNVWILSSELWTQVLSLPSDVALRLEGGGNRPGVGLRGRAVLGDQRLGSGRRASARCPARALSGPSG